MPKVSTAAKRPKITASAKRPKITASAKRPKITAAPKRPKAKAAPKRPKITAAPKRTVTVPKAKVISPKRPTVTAAERSQARIVEAAIEAARARQTKRATRARTRRRAARAEEARIEATRREIEEQRQEERAAQGTPKPVRRTLKKKRKTIEERRAKRGVVTEDLPRETKKETLASREDLFEKLRPNFRKLLEKAFEAGQDPLARKRMRRHFETVDNIGEQVRVRVRRILSPDVVEEIVYNVDRAARSLPGNRSVWYASVSFSGLGEKLFGYDTRLLKLPEDKKQWPAELRDMAHHFQASGHDTTGVWNAFEGMIHALRKILEDYAGAARSVAYVHSILVRNYDRKRPGQPSGGRA